MRLLVVFVAATVVACSAPRSRPAVEPSAPSVPPQAPIEHADERGDVPKDAVVAPAAPQTPAPWLGAREVASNGGTYLVRWRSEPGEIPRGPLFAIDAWVFDARAPDAPLADVELVVDAAMPEHLHGMNRVPTIARSGQGFRVEGMKLHMPGNWELYFDVARGPIVERAQERFELE